MKISWMELVLGAEAAARIMPPWGRLLIQWGHPEPVIPREETLPAHVSVQTLAPRCFPTYFWRWKLCFYMFYILG